MISADERRNILSQPHINKHDIEKLEGCSEKTAQEIMRTCRRKHKGEVIMNRYKITTDSYLEYLGLKVTWLDLLLNNEPKKESEC